MLVLIHARECIKVSCDAPRSALQEKHAEVLGQRLRQAAIRPRETENLPVAS